MRRVAISIPVLFGITVFTFLFINLAPGDPTLAMFDPEQLARMNREDLEARRERLGLNEPLPIRYLTWLRELLRGNLGYSTIDHTSVGGEIVARVGPTLELTLTSLILSLLIAIPLGVISALRQYSAVDYTFTVLSFVAVSVPSFFAAIGAIYIFSLRLDWLPTSGRGTAGSAGGAGDYLKHLILPMTILTLERVGPFTRYVRSSMLEAARQDYVVTARSKGLTERVVVLRHALRNVLTPFITIVGLSLPGVLGGVVIIETIFSWPGIGLLTIKAVNQRDYTMLMGLALVSAVAIIISNLVADLCYAIADPRIRYS
ncbi:MAG: peptide/nickel transport system permease protein [Thermomicrobiales bacterium]|nr:peptide/nickel transport system permease protein [Thermomicrobiales bacterium]